VTAVIMKLGLQFGPDHDPRFMIGETGAAATIGETV